jgi:hypothetical protein
MVLTPVFHAASRRQRALSACAECRGDQEGQAPEGQKDFAFRGIEEFRPKSAKSAAKRQAPGPAFTNRGRRSGGRVARLDQAADSLTQLRAVHVHEPQRRAAPQLQQFLVVVADMATVQLFRSVFAAIDEFLPMTSSCNEVGTTTRQWSGR